MAEPTSALNTMKLDRVAASRQKSCNACVRGKRRCDKKTPQCTRCSAKGLDCVYQKMPSSSESPPMSTGTPFISDFDMNFGTDCLGGSTDPESLHSDLSLQLDPSLDFSMVDLVSTGSSSSGASPSDDLWNLGHDFTISSKMDLPPIPMVPRLPIRDLATMNRGGVCEIPSMDLVHIYDPQTRIGYMFEYMKNIHVTFCKNHSLPFMHPRLWSQNPPKTIMSAFAAATAQANSSSQNKGWSCKLIMDAANDIHLEGDRATTPHEKLARVQALILVHIIRMFDGDLSLRAAAERENATLQAWIKDLMDTATQLEEGLTPEELCSKERPPKTWESWILLESLRRTLLMSLSTLCIIAVLKSGEWGFQPMDFCYHFTASRHLWEARSATEFYRAWREKPQFCINNFSFAEFWQYAQPDDLDEFTKLLLTVQSGPDVLEKFYGDEVPLV